MREICVVLYLVANYSCLRYYSLDMTLCKFNFRIVMLLIYRICDTLSHLMHFVFCEVIIPIFTSQDIAQNQIKKNTCIRILIFSYLVPAVNFSV